MHQLPRFEANMLEILYAVLGGPSTGQALSRVRQTPTFNGCLSAAAVELAQAALAKGMTHWLTSQGGWRSERFLRADQAVSGTIWQRSSPSALGLTFSKSSLQFLIWLTANNPLDSRADPWKGLGRLTVGDQLLMLRTLDWLKLTEVGDRWFRMRRFAELPLVALCYPDYVTSILSSTTPSKPNATASTSARATKTPRPIAPDFNAWLPELAMVLECLQPFLASRWIEVELGKASLSDSQAMQSLGSTQVTVLNSFMQAAVVGRRDLARFLLVALQKLVASDVSPEQWSRRWVRDLRLGDMRLAERTMVYQSASSFLAIAGPLRAWAEECRQVGYFDEGYAAAQLWLADWARYDGEQVTQRALAMVRALNVY